MFGLKQITLHNSYYNGLTVAVSSDGHTNCSGTNAAGKTSMLQLVPFFFGCPPSRFNPKNKDKLPFVDFVLPRHSSLIIYDYRRKDGDCCAVMYRSPSNTVAYRFVSATSKDSFFTPAIHPLLQQGAAASEVFSAMAAAGVELSNQLLTISEYAAVIQGDVASLRRMGDKGRVRDAQRYGLATTSQPMRFMGEMTFTLLKRARMYEELKRMMANTLFDYSAPDIPKHRNNEKLSSDLKGLREFELHKGSIHRCVNLHHERLHLRTAIERYGRGVQQSLTLSYEQTTELEALRSGMLLSQDSLQTRYEQEKADLSDKKISLQQTVKNLQRFIKNAEDDQERWLNNKISQKQADAEKLADFREQAEVAEQHYQVLLSENRQIADQRDSKLNAIARRVNQRQGEYYADLAEKKQQREALEDEYRSKLQALSDEEGQQLEQSRLEASREKERQLPDIGRLREAIKLGGLNEDEKVAEIAAEDKLAEHDGNIDVLAEQLERQQEAARRAKEQHRQGLQKLELARTALAQSRALSEKLERILHPEDDSLLAYLRSQLPGWQQTIGKVIDPELLGHRNLSPLAVAGDSLYGLAIDLAKLPRADHAEDEALLKERIDQAATQQRLLESEKQQQEARVAELKRDWDSQQLQWETSVRHYKLAQAARTAAKEHLVRLRANHQQRVLERKQLARQELNRLEERLKSEQQKHETHLKQVRERYAQRREVLVSDSLVAKSEIDIQIDQLNENFQVLQDQAAEEVAELKDAFARQSDNLGIDEATLQAAKQRAQAAQDRYKQVQGYGDEVQKYEYFVRNTWSQVEAQRDECNLCETKLDGLMQSIDDLNNHFREEKTKIKQQLTLVERQLKEKKELVDEAEQLLKQVGELTEGDAESGELAGLCSELAAMLPRASELKTAVLGAVSNAVNSLQANPESKIYSAWQMLSEQRMANSLYPGYSDEYRLNQPLDLEILLDQHVPQIRSAVIEATKAVGATFEEFYRTLRQLELDVVRVSRELKKKVNTDQRIAALQDIRLELSSKIATAVDGWQDLQGFVQLWEEWQGGFGQHLPPESLEQALARVISQFQATNIKMDIGSLFDLEIHMVESGRPTCINSNAAFDDASSNGLSYLALVVIFVGLSRYLCPDERVTLTWPVDELATLDPKNVAALFTMLKNNNIEVFSAFPSTDYNLLQHFANRYTLERTTGARQFLDSSEDLAQVEKFVDALG